MIQIRANLTNLENQTFQENELINRILVYLLTVFALLGIKKQLQISTESCPWNSLKDLDNCINENNKREQFQTLLGAIHDFPEPSESEKTELEKMYLNLKSLFIPLIQDLGLCQAQFLASLKIYCDSLMQALEEELKRSTTSFASPK